MSIHSEYTRLVNKYLDGGMSGSELEIFEEQLISDPLLRAEFDHQHEIVSGLKEFRKAELKAHLNSISVSPGILGILSQSVSLKTLSYVMTTLLVGTGSYFYFNSSSSVEQVQLQRLYAKGGYWHPEYDANTNILTDWEYSGYQQPKAWSEPIVQQGQSSIQIEEEPVQSVAFDVPEVTDNASGDEVPQPDQILEKTNKLSVEGDISEFEKVDIQNVVSSRYKFHYKLNDNKLYLYGKFEASPYEILEINSFQSKKMFFHYNGHYYRLHQRLKQIAPLVKITDSKVIKELSIIKSKH